MIDPADQGVDSRAVLVVHLSELPGLRERVGLIDQQDPSDACFRAFGLRDVPSDVVECTGQELGHLTDSPRATCTETERKQHDVDRSSAGNLLSQMSR